MIGVLKTDNKVQKKWITTVWVLDGGHTRTIAVKADVVAKEDISGDFALQLPLMDARGNLV